MSAPTHYQTLGLSPQATSQEIKQAYRRLVKQFHPDSQTADADRETTVALNAAYEVLSDPQRRCHYDRELADTAVPQRQRRTVRNQRHYQQARQQNATREPDLEAWLTGVYGPVQQLIDQILQPLTTQLDDLAADPFDDDLMADFQDYLATCRDRLHQAQQHFRSQPNPAQAARAAAHLYYCLNHLGDGLDEFEWFVLNYDDSYLHAGYEFFRRAQGLWAEALGDLKRWL